MRLTFGGGITENHGVLKLLRYPFLLLFLGSILTADDGLWPYNQFPFAVLKDKYGFDPPTDFLDRLRLASVRIGGGAQVVSGSFVSENGLVVTNRQAAAACFGGDPALQAGGFQAGGFQAGKGDAERPCPGLDASVLLRLEDVTAKLKPGATLAERTAEIAQVEKECAAKSGNVCQVVRLFEGGRYDLYQYKRYTDLRLVFAPEYSAAFFGKERDSITYLRYGLNVAFLRVYEAGSPAKTPGFLKWSTAGIQDQELVFSAGNPGPTARIATASQLAFLRDTALPLELSRLRARIGVLQTLTPANDAEAKAVQDVLTPMLAVFKSEAGKLIGLRDARLMTRKSSFEGKIRRAVEADSKLGLPATKVWDDMSSAYKKWAASEKTWQILEASAAPGSRLFARARQSVRGEALASLDGCNERVETLMLTQYLEDLKWLGEGEVPVKAILGKLTPKQAAEAMVQGSGMLKNRAAAPAKDDPVVRLATQLEPAAQKVRKKREELIGSLEVTAAEKIAQYRFQLFGATDYPDGTSTPRVTFGTVSGYTDRASVAQPFASTFSGMYYRQNNEGPWEVAERWVSSRPHLREVTPLDFVSTCDLGGGDYGAAVVNRAGELVGVTFDGNLESLPNVYLYVGEQARAVHVDARGIAEALDRVYGAAELIRELGLKMREAGVD